MNNEVRMWICITLANAAILSDHLALSTVWVVWAAVFGALALIKNGG